MRLIFLSQWCDPEPDPRVFPLAKAMAARGDQVTVITGFPNYPQGRIYPGYRQRLWQWEERDGVRILRLPLYPDHSRSSLKRVLNYLSFALSASILGPFLCGPADLLWVYHPPLTVGIPAWWIGLMQRIPFIYEVHDLWPETVLVSGMMSGGRAAKWLNRLAAFVYKRAAAISVVSPGFKRNLSGKGVPAEKIHVIPDWADEGIYRPMPKEADFGTQHGLAGKFNVIFAGNMGPAQALDVVLQAAALLSDLPDVQIVLVGDGLETPRLKAEAERQGLANVRFVGRQPAAEMPRFFAWADALLVQLKDDPLFHITIPSKTLAYLACGRPILCAVPGDGADVVREAGAGLTCPPEDPAALAEAIRQLYAMPAAQREDMGRSGRQTFVEKYSHAVLLKKYTGLFAEVATSPRNPLVTASREGERSPIHGGGD